MTHWRVFALGCAVQLLGHQQLWRGQRPWQRHRLGEQRHRAHQPRMARGNGAAGVPPRHWLRGCQAVLPQRHHSARWCGAGHWRCGGAFAKVLQPKRAGLLWQAALGAQRLGGHRRLFAGAKRGVPTGGWAGRAAPEGVFQRRGLVHQGA